MSKAKDKKPPRGPGRGGGDVGKALRSVYDHTLREQIPPSMLDLLKNLDRLSIADDPD